MRYVLIVLTLFGLLGAAPEITVRNIRLSDPWVYETSASSTLVNVVIANIASRSDRLLRASTPIAAKVALWNQDAKVGSGLGIPGRAEFVIGGDFPRIELIGLTEILRPDTTFSLLLVFEQAGKITVDVRVKGART